MSAHWQLILVLLIVAAAACSLLRRLVRLLRGAHSAGCGSQAAGSCHGCTSGSEAVRRPLVELSTLDHRFHTTSAGRPHDTARSSSGNGER